MAQSQLESQPAVTSSRRLPRTLTGIEICTPAPLFLGWGDNEACSALAPRIPAVVSFSTRDALLPSFPSLSHFPLPYGVSWDHLLNMLFAFEPFSQGLLLGGPLKTDTRQRCWDNDKYWLDFQIPYL